MAAKRAARSSSCGPDSPLTVNQIEKLRRRCFGYFHDFTEQEWNDLIALLPPGSKGRDVFHYLFSTAAHRYWSAVGNSPTLQEKQQINDLKKLLHGLRRLREKHKPRAPEFSVVPFKPLPGDRPSRLYFQATDPHSKAIAAIRSVERDLLLHIAHPRIDRRDPVERRRFVYTMLRLWEHCGGTVTRSRYKGKPSNALMRFLTCACRLVMGGDSPGAESLVHYIKLYRSGTLRPRSRLV